MDKQTTNCNNKAPQQCACSATLSKIPVGGVILGEGDIEYNTSKTPRTLSVKNTGDRPIQVGSHFHFFEVNRLLVFDREVAFGCHLNIPSTTAVRFEPGEEKSVEVVPFGGKRRVIGFGGLVQGFTGIESAPTYYPTKAKARKKAKKRGYKTLDKE